MKTRMFARRTDRSVVQDVPRWAAALFILFVVLVLPDRLSDFGWPMLTRFPLELPLIVLGLVAFAGRAGGVVRAAIVAVLTVLLLFKLANIGAHFGFARPFNVLIDTLMVPTVLDTLGKSRGTAAVVGVVAGGIVIVAAIVAALAWATGVIARGVSRTGQLPVAMAAFAAILLTIVPGVQSFANWNTSLFVRDQTAAAAQSLRDGAAFRAQLLKDPFGDLPRDSLLAGLKGKDVLLIFVESYGRSALDNPSYAPLVRDTLRRFNEEIAARGFTARSAWLDSPTFGGESYLAHSTALSGLWVDNQQRYVQLLRSNYGTLISDFNSAGWHTVTAMPVITMPWPEAAFFKYGKIYSAPDLGYKGEPFGYMTMPDQYTLATFHAREMAPAERKPVMAEIALISSHIPWVPIPKLVAWEDVGDGTVFNTARELENTDEIWRDPKLIGNAYALSVNYVLNTLASYVTTFGDDNTLMIVVGDHQPMGFIAGENASHEVPVHIIARDPALLAALEQGTWAPGMEPHADSPSWPMDTLRKRLLEAFTPTADGSLSVVPELQSEPQSDAHSEKQ